MHADPESIKALIKSGDILINRLQGSFGILRFRDITDLLCPRHDRLKRVKISFLSVLVLDYSLAQPPLKVSVSV